MTLQYTPLMDGRLIWDDGSAMHVVYAVETPEEALPLMLTRCGRDVPANAAQTPGTGETIPEITCEACRAAAVTTLS